LSRFLPSKCPERDVRHLAYQVVLLYVYVIETCVKLRFTAQGNFPNLYETSGADGAT
jgi:hypothetical protein